MHKSCKIVTKHLGAYCFLCNSLHCKCKLRQHPIERHSEEGKKSNKTSRMVNSPWKPNTSLVAFEKNPILFKMPHAQQSCVRSLETGKLTTFFVNYSVEELTTKSKISFPHVRHRWYHCDVNRKLSLCWNASLSSWIISIRNHNQFWFYQWWPPFYSDIHH